KPSAETRCAPARSPASSFHGRVTAFRVTSASWRTSSSAGSALSEERNDYRVSLPNQVDRARPTRGRPRRIPASPRRERTKSRSDDHRATPLELDPEMETPGRLVVRHIGESLVEAMEMALDDGPPEAAQLVACEWVVEAETKDHLNWELIHEVAEKAKGDLKQTLMNAYDQVEDEEDEHLYHTTGWCRELWIESLGMPAVLPPPEEEQEVKTAIGAARAKKARKQML